MVLFLRLGKEYKLLFGAVEGIELADLRNDPNEDDYVVLTPVFL